MKRFGIWYLESLPCTITLGTLSGAITAPIYTHSDNKNRYKHDMVSHLTVTIESSIPGIFVGAMLGIIYPLLLPGLILGVVTYYKD